MEEKIRVMGKRYEKRRWRGFWSDSLVRLKTDTGIENSVVKRVCSDATTRWAGVMRMKRKKEPSGLSKLESFEKDTVGRGGWGRLACGKLKENLDKFFGLWSLGSLLRGLVKEGKLGKEGREK